MIIEFDWDEMVSMLPARAPVLENPFNISRPAGGNMFFGRSEEIKIMQRELCDAAEGRALLLYGPRRSGKSSLCKQFIERDIHARICLNGAARITARRVLLPHRIIRAA